MPLLIVIRLAGQDLVGPVELLEQHDAGELVGQRHPAEREPRVAAVEVEATRAADDEAEIAAVLPALLQPAAQLHGVELAAVACEQHEVVPFRDPLRHPLVLAHLDQLEPRVARDQLAVVLHVVLEGRPQAPYRDHRDPHAGAILRACPRTASATSTSTPTRRRWQGITPTSPTSRTPITSSRSPSPAWTTRWRRERSRVWSSRGSTSRRASCAS